MEKITILGATASGKTTLAKTIGRLLSIPVTHLDKIFWKEKGGIKQDIFLTEIEKVMENKKWIIEGSMPRSITLIPRIKNADIIIFYNLPIWIVLFRQTKRFFRYFNTIRSDMGGGNIQKYPFTIKDIKHFINYPNKFLLAEIMKHKNTKKIFIIKNLLDEKKLLKYFMNQAK